MKKTLIFIILLFALVLGLNVLFYYIYFPGSTVDGNTVSWNLRPEDRHEPMDKQLFFTSEKVSLHEEVTPKGFFSYSYQLPKKQLFTLYPLHLTTKREIVYDEGKLTQNVDRVMENLPKNQEAKDAHLSLKNGEIILEPAKRQISLPDLKGLTALAKESIAKGKFELSLDAYFSEPKVPSSELRLIANDWKKRHLLCKDYSWNLEGKEYLSLFNADFTLNKAKATKVFKEYFDEEDGGNTMWMVNQEDSLPIFLKALEENETTWEPSYMRVSRTPDADYALHNGIAVSLNRQWLWLYRDGNVVFEAPVITGNPNKGYGTHRGYWSILSMDTNTRLVNTNREGYSYDVPVQFWMQINNEGMIEGIHDADWQWAFGTDHYLYGGSHGCINLHPQDMAGLYYQCWVGMPVWVY